VRAVSARAQTQVHAVSASVQKQVCAVSNTISNSGQTPCFYIIPMKF